MTNILLLPSFSQRICILLNVNRLNQLSAFLLQSLLKGLYFLKKVFGFFHCIVNLSIPSTQFGILPVRIAKRLVRKEWFMGRVIAGEDKWRYSGTKTFQLAQGGDGFCISCIVGCVARKRIYCSCTDLFQAIFCYQLCKIGLLSPMFAAHLSTVS